ncbi:asparagine synthase-related protein [Streptomyces sp. NPDC059008]|uniref:asparagine synthase-related protein n=1 Tax=Streptomyces sp. NPDC059008 TaxID=3346693 RepID=UPI00369157D9
MPSARSVPGIGRRLGSVTAHQVECSPTVDFLVFPDHPAGQALCRLLPAGPPAHLLRHPSGRPWIVGRWTADEAVTAEAGPRRAVLLGTASASPGALARLLPGPGHLDGVGERVRRIPGSYVLLTAAEGDLRCRGDLATVHPVHHARIGGITVAGNRPQDLAALARAAAGAHPPCGAPGTGLVDEESLALRLLFPFAPLPLALRPLWRSVLAVPPGHHLTLYANGRHSVARWWQPPEPDASLEQAAQTVRRALTDAVAARADRVRRAAHGAAGSGGTLSADLFGATDSAGLAFLAAREDVPLLTASWGCRHRGADTTGGARAAARPGAVPHQRERPAGRDGCRRSCPCDGEHLVLPYAEAPTWYTPPDDPGHPTPADPAAPLAAFHEAARLAHLARLLAAHGSRLHLAGVGADALFAHRPAALNSLARSDPRTAARRAWTAHHLCHWKARDTLRTLLGGCSYPRWLAGSAPRVAVTGPRTTGADWEVRAALPPWTHPDAVAVVRRLLREAAARAPEPFAPLRSPHETVRAAVRAGESVRGIAALASAYGIGYEAPFLDDAVIEAALTLRLADRTRAGVHAPLLTRALRGIVPGAVLSRGTTVGHDAEARTGLRTHRDALAALCDDSLLAERGLIRPGVLKHHLTSPQPSPHTADPTLATEYWLRAHDPGRTPAPEVPGPALSVPARRPRPAARN